MGGDGGVSFDDGVGEVSGVRVLCRTPHGAGGLRLHINGGQDGR